MKTVRNAFLLYAFCISFASAFLPSGCGRTELDLTVEQDGSASLDGTFPEGSIGVDGMTLGDSTTTGDGAGRDGTGVVDGPIVGDARPGTDAPLADGIRPDAPTPG